MSFCCKGAACFTVPIRRAIDHRCGV